MTEARSQRSGEEEEEGSKSGSLSERMADLPSFFLRDSGGGAGVGMVVVCLGLGRITGQGAWLTLVQVVIVGCRVY